MSTAVRTTEQVENLTLSLLKDEQEVNPKVFVLKDDLDIVLHPPRIEGMKPVYRRGNRVKVNGLTFASIKQLSDYSHSILNSYSYGWKLEGEALAHFRAMLRIAGYQKASANEEAVVWKQKYVLQSRFFIGVAWVGEHGNLESQSILEIVDRVSAAVHPDSPGRVRARKAGGEQDAERDEPLPF